MPLERVPLGRALGCLLVAALACLGSWALYRALELPHGLNGPEYDQYLALVEELNEALQAEPPANPDRRARWERYRRIERDARAFAAVLEEDPAVSAVFAHDRRHDIEGLLQGPGSAARVRSLDERPVFESFKGGWRGAWRQEGSTFIADHHWHTPEALDADPAVHAQAVLMGVWDPDRGQRRSNTVAVNAVSYETGRIVGAVGLRDGRAARPHVGFFVDPRTLLWVALEGERSNDPVYSVFWERASDDAYTIDGVGFAWDEGAGSLRDVTPKRGDYRTHTTGEAVLEAVPSRLPGRLDQTEPDPRPTISRP